MTPPVTPAVQQVQRHLVPTAYGYVHLRTTGGHTAAGADQADPGADLPTVLLLHQIPASSRIWLPVMHALGPIRCVAPDMLNLGESDATDHPLSLTEHAELLFAAAQQVAPGPVAVVGHHTGAVLAAHLAATHPDQVTALGLLGYPYYETWRRQFSRFERLNPVRLEPDGSGVADVWRFIQRAFQPGSDQELVFEAFADRIRAGRVWYEGYVGLFTSDLAAIATAARNPSRPTVLVTPENDLLHPVTATVGELLGVTPRTIAGGSFVLLEDPASVATVITDLLALGEGS